MFDIFHPEYTKIGADATLGYNVTVLCHEFLRGEYRLGKVEIGPGVLVGVNTAILPGVKVGEGAVVAACSLVNEDIPLFALAGGIPARVLKEKFAERESEG